jgi:SAM-dependent methyltransferase
MKAINRDLGAYYAQRAAEYDRVYDKPERQADLAELKNILSVQFKDLDVLEIACGTGYWTQYVARSAKSITATDVNPEMLEMAHKRDYGQCAVHFQIADAYRLPVFTTLYSAGLAAFWWSHVPLARRAELIRSFQAGLSEGARVVWIDGRYVEGSSTPLVRRDQAGNTFQVRQLSNGSRHEVIKNYPSENDLKAAFAPFASQLEVISFPYFWLLRYNVKRALPADPVH